jgi:membrane protein insertase Oxa1/YidC/SpoIIIJ|tara:strand:+ start:1537 stop:1884 length:348 start_codon:yes stop_codon:yes gene_type:complete
MDNKELLGWFNARFYPMIAIVIAFFAFFAPFLAFIGAEHPNHDIPLIIVSIAFSVLTLIMVLSTISDMKLLSEDMSPELANSKFGQSFKGFTVFSVIFTVLILAVPIAHWIVLFG